MEVNSSVYVRFGEDRSNHSLRIARVASHEDSRMVLCVSAEAPPELGRVIDVFFTLDQRLHRQRCNIVDVVHTSDVAFMTVQLIGAPVHADKRDQFRASTAARDLHATVNDDEQCRIVNIGFEGMAIISSHTLRIDDSIKVALKAGTVSAQGQAVVRNQCPIDLHRARYGLQCEAGHSAALTRTLKELCMNIQREQLRRRSGRGSLNRPRGSVT